MARSNFQSRAYFDSASSQPLGSYLRPLFSCPDPSLWSLINYDTAASANSFYGSGHFIIVKAISSESQFIELRIPDDVQDQMLHMDAATLSSLFQVLGAAHRSS